MELTAKQAEALDICLKRYKNGEKYTVIAGFAGSGKSTTIKFIVDALEGLGVNRNSIGYATPTGKAADVLISKGNKNATTLHKLLWEWRPKANGTFFRIPRPVLEYRVVIVDEVSMVPKDIIDQLLGHDVYVIFCGDPYQLPPIYKDDDNHLLDKPHVFLNEIMRQALDSEIIRLSMEIRNGNMINPKEYLKDVKILKREEMSTGMMTWADQIICATNATRKQLNAEMRSLLGHTSTLPEAGDKVISLHNEWDICDGSGNALINGTIGTLVNPRTQSAWVPKFWGGGKLYTTYSSLKTDNDEIFHNLPMDTNMIINGEKCVDQKLAWKIYKSKGKYGVSVPLEFTYGYAITCHKAQGSSWPKALVVEEKYPFDKIEHHRWLYTAVTRVEDKLVLLKE